MKKVYCVLVLILCVTLTGSTFVGQINDGDDIVECESGTTNVKCSYKSSDNGGKVRIDKTRDIYVDGKLYRVADADKEGIEVTKEQALEAIEK